MNNGIANAIAITGAGGLGNPLNQLSFSTYGSIASIGELNRTPSVSNYPFRARFIAPTAWAASATLSEASVSLVSGVYYKRKIETTTGPAAGTITTTRVVNVDGDGWETETVSVPGTPGPPPNVTTTTYHDPVTEADLSPVVDVRLDNAESGSSGGIGSPFVNSNTLYKIRIDDPGSWALDEYITDGGAFTTIATGSLGYSLYPQDALFGGVDPDDIELAEPYFGELDYIAKVPHGAIPECSWKILSDWQATEMGGGFSPGIPTLSEFNASIFAYRMICPSFKLLVRNNSDESQEYAVKVYALRTGTTEEVIFDTDITVPANSDSADLDVDEPVFEWTGGSLSDVTGFHLRVTPTDSEHVYSRSFAAGTYLVMIKGNSYSPATLTPRGVGRTGGVSGLYGEASRVFSAFLVTKHLIIDRLKLGLDPGSGTNSQTTMNVMSDYADELEANGYFSISPTPTDMRVAVISDGRCSGIDGVAMSGTAALPMQTVSKTYLLFRDQFRIVDLVAEYGVGVI